MLLLVCWRLWHHRWLRRWKTLHSHGWLLLLLGRWSWWGRVRVELLLLLGRWHSQRL